MARMIMKVGKASRREDYVLHAKSGKVLAKRNYAPGQHGAARKGKPSNFALQLREKQKIKRIYGVLEKQFKKYAIKAGKKAGVAGENLLVMLETRLDNVVYRTQRSRSRQSARQLVSHKHIFVNGKKVNIPSFTVKVGDKISFNNKIIDKLFTSPKAELPAWLQKDGDDVYKVISMPVRADIEPGIEEQLVIEYYSK